MSATPAETASNVSNSRTRVFAGYTVTFSRPSETAVIDCASRSAPARSPGISSVQSVTSLSSLTPCAIAGAGKLPPAAIAVAPSSTSRRRLLIAALIFLSQRQAPCVAVPGFRQFTPIHDAGEKGYVAVVDLAGQRILGGRVG